MNERSDGLIGAGSRFGVAADGTVSGDDGTGGQLAASLRYAVRMASQVDSLTGVGDLVRLSTIGSITVIARVDSCAGNEFALTVHVDPTTSTPSPFVKRGSDGSNGITRSLHRTQQMLDTQWCALITGDHRLVGRAMHGTDRSTSISLGVLDEVGLRVLALLGAVGPDFRETGVVLDYQRSAILVVPIAEHALFAMADRFERHLVSALVNEVRSVLSPRRLARAETVDEPLA